MNDKNITENTIKSFGDEWTRFDQSKLSYSEAKKIFDEYFNTFPWDKISNDSIGFDMGCGTGRWANFIAYKCAHLYCIDPSSAIDVAKLKLNKHSNITFINKSVFDSPLPENSQDFGYSLGVLHHVDETKLAIKCCSKMLKKNSPFLLYLYYSFENRSKFFIHIWKISNLIRIFVSKLPPVLKQFITDLIALFIYFPLSLISKIIELFGIDPFFIPLSYYRNCSFYTMRTDSRDRFGTPLEKRFSKQEISLMLDEAGFIDIKFSESAPYWCVSAIKK